MLAWHWRVWQSFGTKERTVNVLHWGYKVLFHHLPSVLLEPRELPSCSPGLVQALAL